MRRKKALLTGSTPIQVGSKKTQLQIVTAAAAWREALTDLGYDVDHRAVTPGEDLSGYDAAVACLNKPNSIASSYFYGALWALTSHPHAIAAVDDWQTDELVSGIRTVSRCEERAFRLVKNEIEPRVKARLFSALGEMNAKRWPWPVVAPVLGEGDVSLLKLPAGVVAIDPTRYAHRYPLAPKIRRENRWVLASLLNKPLPDGLSWPVAKYGFQDRGIGGCQRKAGDEAWPRVPEPELMAVYQGAAGVLSPPHPHAGSGWWRVRYLMAADAGCVLSGDLAEARCLGEPYEAASDPLRVEALGPRKLAELARAQVACLEEISWPKERVLDILKRVLKGAKR